MFDLEIVVWHGEWNMGRDGSYRNVAAAGEIAFERHRLKRGNTDFAGICLCPSEKERILIRDRPEELEEHFFGSDFRYNDDEFLYDDMSPNLVRLVLKHQRKLPRHFDMTVAFDMLEDASDDTFGSLEHAWHALRRHSREPPSAHFFLESAEAYGFRGDSFTFMHAVPEASEMDKRHVEQLLREADIDPLTLFGAGTIDRRPAFIGWANGERWFFNWPDGDCGAPAA